MNLGVHNNFFKETKKIPLDWQKKWEPSNIRIANYVAALKNGELPNNKQPAISPKVLELENNKIDENDLETWEAENNLQKLQNVVFDEFDFAHPVESSDNNICKIVKEGKNSEEG